MQHKYSSRRCSYSWLLAALTLIVALLECTAIADFDTIVDPGATRPKTIDIPVGGSAEIRCIVLKEGLDSSKVWFFEQYRENDMSIRERKISNSDEVTIIDATTLLLQIRNATKQIYNYTCRNDKNAIIGLTKVYVDSKPDEVTDFSCRGFDFEEMECNFTRPRNYLNTKFDLYFRYYKNNNQSLCHLTHSENNSSCKLTMRNDGKNRYLAATENITFNLVAKNVAGITNQNFEINQCSSVILAKPLITILKTTSDSVELSWKSNKSESLTYYNRCNFTYDVQLHLKEDNKTYVPSVHKQCTEHLNCKATINNLEYAYYEYELLLRIRVTTTPQNADMWSATSTATFLTKARQPDVAPTCGTGSYIFSDDRLYLYWQDIPRNKQNGPDFHYVILESDITGRIVNPNKHRANQTYIMLKSNQKDNRSYYIKSSNKIGDSLISSVIRVFPRNAKRSELPDTIVTASDESSYILTWKAPEKITDLKNYTVFWCESRFQICKKSSNFAELEADRTNFTVEHKGAELIFWLSANYDSYSTGMIRQKCTAKKQDELSLSELTLTATSNSTSISLQWSHTICSSIIKGYNITYCEIQNTHENICTNSSQRVITISDGDLYKYKITNLKPYSPYLISIFMYSDSKNGPKIEHIFVTNESGPTKPENVTVETKSINNSAAMISWLPPKVLNGKLRYYTIHYDSDDDRGKEIINASTTDSHSSLNFTLEKLYSYTNYTVYITAHTSSSSEPSDKVTFKTLVGTPSVPLIMDRKLDDMSGGKKYGYVKWAKPKNRTDFYVITLTMKKKNEIINRITLVKDLECCFEVLECSNYVYSVNIYGVNMANQSELNLSNASRNKLAARSISFPSKFTTITSIPEYEDFCIDATPFNKHFKLYTSDQLDVISNDNEIKFRFYPSAATLNETLFSMDCPLLGIKFMAYTYMIVALLPCGMIIYYLYEKYKKMNNIKVVLPQGLTGYTSQTIRPLKIVCDSIVNEKAPIETSPSIDSPVFPKERHHLLPIACKNVISVINGNSIATVVDNVNGGIVERRDSFDKEIDDISKKEDSSDAYSQHEPNSTESTDSVELNDVSDLSYYNKGTNDADQLHNTQFMRNQYQSNYVFRLSKCSNEDEESQKLDSIQMIT